MSDIKLLNMLEQVKNRATAQKLLLDSTREQYNEATANNMIATSKRLLTQMKRQESAYNLTCQEQAEIENAVKAKGDLISPPTLKEFDGQNDKKKTK